MGVRNEDADIHPSMHGLPALVSCLEQLEFPRRREMSELAGNGTGFYSRSGKRALCDPQHFGAPNIA